MIAVPNDAIRRCAERCLTGPVPRGALAMTFSESSASSAEVLVEGNSFYPRMLEDIASASSSVHINQFGFRPGVVGDAFAEALIAKAADGVPVRLVVDRQGSDPERESRAFYDRARRRHPGLRRSRDAAPGARRSVRSAAAARRAGTSPGSGTSTTARSRRRRPHRLGRRSGDRGPLPGRPLPRPVRARHRARSSRSSSSSSSRASAGSAARSRRPSSPRSSLRSTADRTRCPRSSCTTPPGRYRPITDAIARMLESAGETLDVVNPYVTDRR